MHCRAAPIPGIVGVSCRIPPCAWQGLIFFDWDSANLSTRSQEVLACVTQFAERPTTLRFAIAGHTDRSGPADYNQRLSQRRAEAVANELARHGIARERISMSGYGETRPLVPTRDGVREPQNRRVEVVMR
jgi:OmpA-OmpF porin, OOP family